MTHSTWRGRPGLSLIKLLVVIAVLAVLMGLIIAASMFKIPEDGPEMRARRDINGLVAGVGSFQTEFSAVKYVPSRLKLREQGPYNQADPLERATMQFLANLFGSHFNPELAPPAFHDWNNNGTADAQPLELTGDQCLVFALGGIPSRAGSTNAGLGFSKNPADPVSVNAAGNPNDSNRSGPFFDFKSDRLLRGANGFFSYADTFRKGKPYAYFSNYGTQNGYSKYFNVPIPPATSTPTYGTNCQSLMPGGPYAISTTQYHAPSGFQIISAGPDGIFYTTAGSASGLPVSGSMDLGTQDNIANFSRLRLGAPVE